MALSDYSVVNSTELNEKLTNIANAIRLKTRGTSQLSFPTEFIEAINTLSKVSSSLMEITPSSQEQIIGVPAGYDGVSNVKVKPVPIDSNNTATNNGTYNPASGKFFSSFVVAIPTYDGSVD